MGENQQGHSVENLQSEKVANRQLAKSLKNCECSKGVETYWGYIVRSGARPRSSAAVKQWISGLSGLSLVVAAVSLWIIPGSGFGEDIAVFKYGLSIVLGAIGILLIWFGSQGNCYELQVDIAKGELREAVRNRKGQARLLSRVPFERIGSVFIDRAAGAEGADLPLLLRYKETAQVIEVARAPESELAMMRDRLARDILGMSALRKRQQDALKRQPQSWMRTNKSEKASSVA